MPLVDTVLEEGFDRKTVFFFSSILWILDGGVEIFLFFWELWINIIGWVPLCNKDTTKCVKRTDEDAKFKSPHSILYKNIYPFR